MKIKAWRMKHILTAALAVLVAVIIVGAAGFKPLRRLPSRIMQSRQQEEQRVEASLPPVISSIKELEVVNAYIDSQKQANITVFNNSSKGIQGFAVSSGSFMLVEDDGLKTDNPRTTIAPYASYTIQLPASNLRATMPVVISGVIYDDDTEAGDDTVRKKMRDARITEREKRRSGSNDK